MDREKLKKYAALIVRVGANVQKNQRVRLYIDTRQTELATMLVEECYECGASFVEMFWSCSDISKLHYQCCSEEVLGEVPVWERERQKQMVRDLPVRIFIESDSPDAFDGVDPTVIANANRSRMRVLKKYRDAIDNKHQWVIAAAASPEWAQKLFPDMTANDATELLWDYIFKCCRMDEENPVAAWNEHTLMMEEKAAWLNSLKLASLEYKSANGTDFRVELIEGASFHAAADTNITNGVKYIPNMPTEEVFTSPFAGKCSGRLVSTKPLSWNGQLIDNFYIDFKNGRVSGFDAKTGRDALAQLFATDRGATMLGEVALVPKESPVNLSGLMFFNTLFDENACCHAAVGNGFPEVIEGFETKTPKEIRALGVNSSMVHVDFMIGSDDLSVVGICRDGSRVSIFEDGTWAK